ncbi:MAG: DNA alkylation repair protein [Candidatus Bathyarchaeota archaeon]|nr:DNA alkylation repair protein [Candidatus Bathyarchaeum sp.]
MKQLNVKARPDQLVGMARYGIVTENRLGVSIPELRKMAREHGKNHALALELWKTEIPDAMILASMIGEPEQLTERQMDEWVNDFNSWDVCDQVCNNFFSRHSLVWQKILDWSKSDEVFIKRAAFALLSSLAVHYNAPDEIFIDFLSVIKRESTDNRNYVKKAVNWALRNIGKRNSNLNKVAITVAREILEIDSKASRWIASNALRELESDAVKKKLEKMKN